MFVWVDGPLGLFCLALTAVILVIILGAIGSIKTEKGCKILMNCIWASVIFGILYVIFAWIN